MNIDKTKIIALSIILLNTCLTGQWTSDPAINKPVITEAKKQIYPNVVPDGEGGVYLTYLSGSDQNEKIHVTRLDTNLNKLWGAGSVAVTTTFNQQFKPIVLPVEAGGIILFWEEANSIYGQRLDTKGDKLWGPDGYGVARRLMSLRKQSDPDAIRNVDCYIAFYETEKYIRAQRMSVTGDTSQWGGYGVTVFSSTAVNPNPMIAPDGSDGIYVAWILYNQLYCQHINQSGELLWDQNGIRVATDSDSKQNPQMFADGFGNVFFLWESEISAKTRIKAQKIKADGTRWSNQGVYVSEAQTGQFAPAAVRDNDGGFAVVWEDGDSTGVTIYAQQISANGDKLWGATGVDLSYMQQSCANPVIARDLANDYIVAWEENTNIFAQKISADGELIWKDGGLAITTASNEQNSPVIITNETGHVIFLWQDLRNGTDYDFYAQRVDRLGFLGVDETPPVFSHTPISEIDEQTPMTVKVRVEDSQAGVSDVFMWFRNDEQAEFTQFAVSSDSANEYTFDIPADDIILRNVRYYFEASDVYGNSVRFPESGEFTVLVIDKTAPRIEHENIGITQVNQPITISFSSADEESDIQSGVLYYSHGGSSILDSLDMVQSQGNTFSATIDGAAVSSHGIQYYFIVRDSSDNKTRVPPEGWFTIRVSMSGAVASQSQPAGEYKMFSVPMELNVSRPDCVLVDDLGAYNIKNWRLFEWTGGDVKYREFGDAGFSNFVTGQCKWLITKDEASIDVGAGTSVSIDENFYIPLQNGWNMIADPFDFSVSWEDIIKNEVYDTLFGYTGTQWDFADKIEPWNGYFVYATDENASLEIPPINAAESMTKSAHNPFIRKINENGGWAFQLTASCRELQDGINYIGVASSATDMRDKFDLIEPPNPPGDYIALCFPHEEWPQRPKTVTTDFRAPNQDGYQWEFWVLTNIHSSEVRVDFTELVPAPDDYQFMVLDHATHTMNSVRHNSGYVFLSGSKTTVREFTLYAGKDAYFENQSLNSVVPEKIELSQNYPNPFNSATEIRYALPERSRVTIRILNILGKEIKNLVNNEWKDAGYYAVIWDGTDNLNIPAASGIYFYQLITDTYKFNDVRKMLFVK